MRKLCFAALLIPAVAWAQPKTAAEWFKEGDNQYTLGNFEKAIEAFKQAFSLETNVSNRAIYLYNVAQSYRKANDCKNAQFFYRRFLSLKDSDTAKPLTPEKRKEVQDRLVELEACVQAAEKAGRQPPEEPSRPDPDGGKTEPRRAEPPQVGVQDAEGEGEVEGEVTVRHTGTGPRVISLRGSIGGAKVTEPAVPVQFAAAITAGYPIPVAPQLTIDFGGVFTYTPTPFTRNGEDSSQTANLFGLMANAGLSYEVVPKVEARFDLGLGALIYTGVSESPFTGGAPASGALTMFHVRGAASGGYAVTPNVVVGPTVAFSYSPAKEGLTADAIMAVEFMASVGYRM